MSSGRDQERSRAGSGTAGGRRDWRGDEGRPSGRPVAGGGSPVADGEGQSGRRSGVAAHARLDPARVAREDLDGSTWKKTVGYVEKGRGWLRGGSSAVISTNENGNQ
jgi:hypothetical protein